MSDREEIDQRYQHECERWPDRKVEIINGRIVVRELPTFDHAKITLWLLSQLLPVATGRGWLPVWGMKLFLGVQKDRYIPDLLVLPRDPRMWDDENVHAEEALLVVEVVSPSSQSDDHVVKPRNCAAAGVPLYLVIDAFENQVTLFSQPSEAGYLNEVTETIGKPIELPAPWDLTIDTGRLLTGESTGDTGR
jgi:Uma2 family endonuclease